MRAPWLVVILSIVAGATIEATVEATVETETSEWVIALANGTNPEHFARDNNYIYAGPVSFLPLTYVFQRAHRKGEARGEARLEPRDGSPVVWGERQERVRRLFNRSSAGASRRSTSSPDPLYPSQWHLHSHPSSLDADHAGTSTGLGITIAIVDDGLQHTHPDLAANYDAPHSWDYNYNDADPSPSSDDPHGTAAAGIAAAARDNGHCGRGVAPRAKLVGVRAIAAPITDLTEGAALSHNAIGVVDIYSCSWGPVDDGVAMAAPGNVVLQTLALYAGALRGRLGKGSIYVWAAGNGRANGDHCSFDNYASSIYTIPVGALDYGGNQAWYSESCAALMAVAPSSGSNGQQRITTVDLVGADGYDAGECTSSFGGTSAAAPAAAGVIALILEARPELTWRDVKHVIARGAVQVHADDPEWHINAAGYKHNPKYGFGLLKVPALLAAARAHVLLAEPQYHNTYIGARVHYDPPHSAIPKTAVYQVAGSPLRFIEYVVLQVGITHYARGRVTIELESPEGTVSLMAPERPYDETQDYPGTGFKLTSVRHFGESRVNGAWKIRVKESDAVPVAKRGRGFFNGFQLTIYGY